MGRGTNTQTASGALRPVCTKPPEKISEREGKKLLKKIRPMNFRGDRLGLIKEPDLHDTAFNFTKEEDLDFELPGTPVVVAKITTQHTFGAPSLFKPTAGEVLSQIPEHLLDTVDAFAMDPDSDPHLDQDDSDAWHTGQMLLYAFKDSSGREQHIDSPDEILFGQS